MSIDMMITWAVVMLGAMVQGVTGLGFGLIAVPILLTFQDARSVVATILILSVVLNALILYQARRHITLKDAGPITLGSVLGVPFGSYLLTILSSDALKLIVMTLVLLFSIPLLLGYSRRFRHLPMVSLITGAISGALQSSTSIGSPPVVLLMANQGMAKESFRGTMVLRSMAASALSVVALVPSGLINSGIATHALLMAPAMLIGFAAGTRLLGLVPQALFTRLTILVVAGTALLSLAGYLLR